MSIRQPVGDKQLSKTESDLGPSTTDAVRLLEAPRTVGFIGEHSVTVRKARRVEILSRLILLVGVLLIVSGHSNAAEMTALALQGDGTATVLIGNDKEAFITDGGRGGRSGIAGATIDGKDVLSFLRDEGVRDLVIVCSHPHSDHAGGLISVVRSKHMPSFQSITFVDNDYQRKTGRANLFSEFTKLWGDRAHARYMTAEEWKSAQSSQRERQLAFLPFAGEAHRGPGDPGNETPQPGDRGPKTPIPSGKPPSSDEHDSAIVSQYTLRTPGRELSVVDLDDSSISHIRNWLSTNVAADVLLISHHGSSKNYTPELLRRQAGLRTRDVVFTVNSNNQYFHPDADVLLDALKTLGADHVFITGSTSGDNVTITAEGVTIKYNNRSHLASFIREQIERCERALTNVLDRASVVLERNEIENLLRQRDIDGSFIKEMRDKGAISQKQQQWASKAARALPLLYEAESEVSGNTMESYHGRFSRRFDRLRAIATVNFEGSTGGKEYMDLQAGSSSGKPPTGTSLVPTASLPPRGGGQYFIDALSQKKPTWGGVILGNRPNGDRPVALEILLTGEADEDVMLRLRYEDGSTADYHDITVTELWAAHGFVQPNEEMLRAYPGLTGNAAGIVGLTEKVINPDTRQDIGWRFGLHPAIAGLPVAQDAMRLDMFIATAKKTSLVPRAIRGAAWLEYEFDTYQWFDAPALITAEGGKLIVAAAEGPSSCLMRVRLVQIHYPPWFDHVDQEFERRFRPLRDSIVLQYRQELRELQSRQVSNAMGNSQSFEALSDRMRQAEQQLHARPSGTTDSRSFEEIMRQYNSRNPDFERSLDRLLARSPMLDNQGTSATFLLNAQSLQAYKLARKYQALVDGEHDRVVREVRAEIEQYAERNSTSDSEKMLPHVPQLCEFDATRSVDRLARVIAILNLYGGYGTNELPPLPSSIIPARRDTAAARAYVDVFPRSPEKALDWRIPMLGVILAFLAILIVGIVRYRYRSQRSEPT